MNCPHPVAFRQELTLRQMFRSSYMFVYQSPWLPEMMFQADDLGVFQKLFHRKQTGLVNKDTITDDDIEVYKYTFSQRGKILMNIYPL